MQKLKQYGIGILIVLAIVGYISYQYIKDRANNQRIAIEANLKDQKLIDFKNNSGALLEWNKDISFSYQIQDSISSSTKPVYFKAYLQDIYKNGAEYRAVFDTYNLFGLYLDLKLNQNDLSELTKRQLFSNYHLIVKVDSVKRNQLTISGDTDGSGGVDLKQEPSNTLWVYGDLVNLMISDD